MENMQEDIQKWKSRIEEQRKLDKNKYETKEEKRKNIFTLRFEKKLNKAIKNIVYKGLHWLIKLFGEFNLSV